MVHYLTDYAAAADLAVTYDTRAVRVERDDTGFVVTGQRGETHTARDDDGFLVTVSFALRRILEQRHHGTDWPSTRLPADPAALTDAVSAA